MATSGPSVTARITPESYFIATHVVPCGRSSMRLLLTVFSIPTSSTNARKFGPGSCSGVNLGSVTLMIVSAEGALLLLSALLDV